MVLKTTWRIVKYGWLDPILRISSSASLEGTWETVINLFLSEADAASLEVTLWKPPLHIITVMNTGEPHFLSFFSFFFFLRFFDVDHF